MRPVTIEASHLGKQFSFQAVFQQLSYTFGPSESIAVLGENGSGKSTLLRVLSGMTDATSGKVQWQMDGRKVASYQWYKYLSYCSPDFHFDDRFTVSQILEQYGQVKPFQMELNHYDLIGLMNFQEHSQKQMNELSSGMYQRIRLVLALSADVPVVFLDEPCSNLDEKGVRWYNDLVSRFIQKKLVFVASNDPREYEFCTRSLSLMDYK